MTNFQKLLIGTSLCILPAIGIAQGPLNPADLLKPLGESWPTYSGDYSGKRWSSLKLIDQSNVKNLTLAWVGTVTAGPPGAGAAAGGGFGGGGGRGGGGGGGGTTIVGGEGPDPEQLELDHRVRNPELDQDEHDQNRHAAKNTAEIAAFAVASGRSYFFGFCVVLAPKNTE